MNQSANNAIPSARSITLRDVIQGAETQGRVIFALVLRESKSRYGQHKIGFLWALLEPLLMVSILVLMLTAMRSGQPGGIPLVPFMITGFVPFTMFRNPMDSMQAAIVSSKSLLAFPQVTTFDVIISRSLFEMAVLLCNLPLLLWLAWLLGFGYDLRVQDPLSMLAACTLVWILGTGMGFIFASLAPIMPSIRQVAGLVFGRPLMFTSGIFFTADSLPVPVREVLLYNPLLHALDLIRAACFYEFETQYADWSYLCFWSFGMLTAGLLIHQAVKRRAIVGL